MRRHSNTPEIVYRATRENSRVAHLDPEQGDPRLEEVGDEAAAGGLLVLHPICDSLTI